MTEFLRRGELLPIRGQDLSIPSIYMKDGYGFPENIEYFQGEIRKRAGKSMLAQPTPGNQKVLHLDVFSLSTLSQYLIAHTIYNVLKYNTITNVFDDITGVDLAGSDTDFTDSCTVAELDLYIFTQYINNIRKYNNAGVTTDLGGSPPKAKCIEYFTPYVFIANLSESGLAIPTKGRWCDTGNPELWTGGVSGSALFTLDSSEIRRVKKMADHLFVYKSGMSYRGNLVSTTDIFSFNPFSTSRGLYSPRTLTDANEGHFYMGAGDFHFNDGIRISDIGGPIRESLFNRLNRTRFNTCFSLHAELLKEVWFFITTSGNDWPTEVWKYKYDLGFWYKDTINATMSILTGTNYKVIGTQTWDTTLGTWDQQAGRWDDQSGQADAPLQVFGDRRGIVTYRDPLKFNDNGYVYSGRQETMDYGSRADDPSDPSEIGPEEDLEWMQLDFFALGTSLDVYYSLDFGVTWKFVETKQLTPKMTKYTSWIHVISPQIRFRFENSNPSGYFTFRSLIPYFLSSAQVPGQ